MGVIRQALEETLPPGSVRSADETEPTVEAEVAALAEAIQGVESSSAIGA